MPTYEYTCAACHHDFEVFQSMKDPPISTCEACGEPKAQRRITGGAGFISSGRSSRTASPEDGAALSASLSRMSAKNVNGG